jgi:hypothetical protein
MLPEKPDADLAYFIEDLLHLCGAERAQSLRADVAQRAQG